MYYEYKQCITRWQVILILFKIEKKTTNKQKQNNKKSKENRNNKSKEEKTKQTNKKGEINVQASNKDFLDFISCGFFLFMTSFHL